MRVFPFFCNSRIFREVSDIREGGNHILERLGYSVKELELFLSAMRSHESFLRRQFQEQSNILGKFL